MLRLDKFLKQNTDWYEIIAFVALAIYNPNSELLKQNALNWDLVRQILDEAKPKGVMLINREAKAIFELHLALRTFSEKYFMTSENGRMLGRAIRDALGRGASFDQRLINLEQALNTFNSNFDAVKDLRGIASEPEFQLNLKKIQTELSWLTGDKLEHDRLEQYGLPPLQRLIGDNEFDRDIVDSIVMMSRSGDPDDPDDPAPRAMKDYYQLNFSLLELQDYIHEHPEYGALTAILDNVKKKPGVDDDLFSRLERFQVDVQSEEVQALVKDNTFLKRIFLECLTAIALLLVGYVVAKVVDISKGYDINSCVFFKKAQGPQEKLAQVDSDINELFDCANYEPDSSENSL